MSAYLHRPRHELFDLQADPDEIHNLADDPRHKQTLDDLQARLKAWQSAPTIRGFSSGNVNSSLRRWTADAPRISFHFAAFRHVPRVKNPASHREPGD